MAEKIEGLSIGLDLDSAGIENGLKSLKGKIGLLDSEMRANLSTFDKNEKSMKKYDTQLTGLNKRLDLQKTAVKASKEEYDKMVERHGASSKEAEKAATVYNKQLTSFQNLERRVGNLTDEMKDFERQQQIASSGWTKFGNKLDNSSKKITAFGNGMKSVGTNMTKYVTAPLAGIGVAGFAAANELDKAYGTIRRGTGATGDALEDLKGNFENVFTNVPESAEEVSTALADLNTRTGLTGEALEQATEQFLTLGRVSGEDVPGLIAEGTRAFGDWGIAVEDQAETMDYFWKVSQSTGIGVSDLMGKMVQFGAPLRQMGFDFETSAALLGKFEKEGVNAELVMGSMRQALGKMAKEGIPAEEGLKKTVDAIKNAGSTSEANAAAIELFGSRAGPDMAAAVREGRFEIDDLIASLEESDETIGKAGEETLTFGDRMQTMKNKTMDALEPVGDVIMDVAETYLPKLEAGVEKAASWFEGLGEEGQKMAVGIGAVALAAGPLLVVGAQLAVGLGGIMSTVVPLTTAIAGAGGLAASLGTAGGAIAAFATGPVGLGIAAIAGLTVGGIALAKHMREDAIPEVDRFGDTVSEKTKEALGSFFELSDGASESLMDMRINGLEVTELMADELMTKYEDMNAQILEGMRERHKEELAETTTFFNESSALTDEREKEIVAKMNVRNLEKEKEQKRYEDQLQEIIETATTEKRDFTDAEYAKMDEIHKKMNENAVVYLSANEQEQKVIMERMTSQADELSAQQAAKVTKNSAEARDKVIDDAEQKYNDTIAFAISQRDETGEITAEEAKAIIAEAKKTRDESVGHAEQMHADVVKEAKAQAGEHVDEVDWSTGEILSNWDIYKKGVLKRFRETNESSMEDFKRWGGNISEAAGNVKDDMLDGWEAYKTGINTRFRGAAQNALNRTGDLVNGVIKGINWALEKLDMNKIGYWNVPNVLGRSGAGSASGAPVRAYAHGTHGHPGGLALVGDGKGDNAGEELIRTPDGKVGLSPSTNTILDLPKGTTVLSAKETKKLFEPIPRYANGIGNVLTHAWEAGKDLWNAGKEKAFDIFDYLTNPKKLLDIGLAAVGFKMPTMGGFMKDALSGGLNKLKDGAIDYLKDAFVDFGGSGGAGFGSLFRKTSSFGVRIHPILKTAKQHNGDDYGAPVGTPIPAQAGGRVTVAGFHGIRGNYVRINSGALERIYQHNQRNLVRTGDMVKQGQYIGTVGSTGRSTGPHLHYEVLRNGRPINPRGLATGGVTTGFMTSTLHEEGYPEFVIPTAPHRRTDAMKLLALAGKQLMGKGSEPIRPNQLPNTSSAGSEKAGVMEKLLAATMKQNEILMQLLGKDSNLYVDGDVMAGTLAPRIETINNDRNAMRDSGRYGRRY